jgi:two-component system NtrC family sensor kinase
MPEPADLKRELAAASQREAEGLAREAAMREILRVIASSPTELQAVLDTVVESAARLGEADLAAVLRVEGSSLRRVASTMRELVGVTQPFGRGSINGQAILDRRTIHAFEPEAEYRAKYPDSRMHEFGFQSQLVTPLLREGVPIGTLVVARKERRPFSERQIALLQTFADQAVIAIENTRLFRELQDRNRDLAEALEQQTATGEILRVIASSPTNLQPVLDAVADSAARLCEAEEVVILRLEGGLLKRVAAYGTWAEGVDPGGIPLNRGSVSGRSVVDRRTIHVHDLAAEPEGRYPQGRELQRRFGHRTMLASPLLRQGAAIGTICVFRLEVRPFAEKQVELLGTFADQAVIAIENARLFRELRSRVEELQALGEVGRAVSSTQDLERVLTTVVSHADQLSGTDGGVLYEYGEATQEFALRASRQLDPEVVETLRSTRIRLGEGAIGQAALAHEPIEIPDILIEGANRARCGTR